MEKTLPFGKVLLVGSREALGMGTLSATDTEGAGGKGSAATSSTTDR
jgi:hypothetical protein